MNSALTALVLLFAIIGSLFTSYAQQCRLPQTRAWIAVTNAVGYMDTLWFGFDSTATCGEDPALCELHVVEPCGLPSNFFCVFWSSPCGPGPGSIVLLRYDFRAYVHPAKIDTHRIRFQPGDSGYPLTFRWSREAVTAICDSAVLRYWSGVFYRQRMDLSDSLVMTDESVFQVQLFRYGQRLTPTRVSEAVERPPSFELSQNYPNPFNPTTTLSFRIPHSTFVVLKVYNILGEEVRTLVNGKKEAGTHNVLFDAVGLPSGVYFYRLTTPPFSQTKAMVVMK